MTPQEKANELVVKYLRIENSNEWWSKVPAKECALIAVDEIILEMGSIMLPNPFKQYWQEVKQEIEKL